MEPVLESSMRTNGHGDASRQGSETEDARPDVDTSEGEAFYSTYPDEPLDTEFKRKYPPDRFGEEAAENARVWKIYRDEATAADRSMLNGWNRTLDILLIFAGLFSAVSTAFIIESYKLLQVDNTQYIAQALYLSLSAGRDAPISLEPPGANFLAPGLARWINGLWFSSLVLSLAVALLAILAKQWLEEYTMRTAGPTRSLRHWSRRHVFFNRALGRWCIPAFVHSLPVVLHASLFLFLAGLVLFLRQLDGGISSCVLGLALPLLLFYITSAILPAVYADCPWATAIAREVVAMLDASYIRLHHLGLHLRETMHISWLYDKTLGRAVLLRHNPVGRTLLEYRTDLDLLSLQWLIYSSRSADIVEAAIHAFGGLAAEDFCATAFVGVDDILRAVPITADKLTSATAARYARTLLFFASYQTLELQSAPMWAASAGWSLSRLLEPAAVPSEYDLPLLRAMGDADKAPFVRFAPASPQAVSFQTALAKRFLASQQSVDHPPFLASSVRLMLKFMGHNSLRLMIHVYRVQRFDLLADADMEWVAAYLCKALADNGVACAPTSLCNRYLCLAALCRVLHFRAALELDADDVALLVQNIDCTLRSMRADRCTAPRHSADTEHSPYVLKYAASSRFLAEETVDWDTLQAARIALCSHTPVVSHPDAQGALVWEPALGHALAKLVGGFARVVSVPRTRPEELEQANFLNSVLSFLGRVCTASVDDMYGSEAAAHPHLHWRARNACHEECTSPLCILQPFPGTLDGLPISGSQISIWRALIDLLRGTNALAWGVVSIIDVLAAHLCSLHRRGHDVSHLLTEVFCTEVVHEKLFSVALRVHRDRLLRIVSHCTEIDPQWWDKVSRARTRQTMRAILMVEEALSESPRVCAECPSSDLLPRRGGRRDAYARHNQGSWTAAQLLRPFAAI